MNASTRAARHFNLPNRKKRQKFKKKWKPCYICADWGHRGNFCPRVNTCSVCSKKESKNNVEEDHTSLFCLKCGGTGHGMFSCTNDYDPEDLKGIQCYICMDFGHLCCYENSTGGLSEASCYNCGQSGHRGFECTKINAVSKELQQVSICFKCQKGVHSSQIWDLDNKSTSAKTITLGKGEVLDKSTKENSRKTQTGELDNKLTSTETTTLEKDVVPSKTIKRKCREAQAGEKVNKSTSAETSAARKNAVPDKSIEGKSRKTLRRERRWKRKPVMPTYNVVQSLPTVSMIGNTIPRHGQYYGNPGSNVRLSPPAAAARTCLVNSPAVNQSSYGRPGLNVWLSPPAAAARNCLLNSPALNQSSYGRPGLNVWLPPPAAAARNYLEISPAVNQSSYQTGFHFYHYNTNYREATQAPPNSFRPYSDRPHEIFHQGTQIPGTPQNRIQHPHQNFTHQIRTHVPQNTFDSRMGISQQPELPHHVSNHHHISAFVPHQKLQHQLPSHRTLMAPPGWKPSS
ncbi:uncharacterized protein [Primulina huaijiensis]|uniref:uncharacterized protein isoform X2 n=1 Tax=Primulina huaijiensis TaxID=1492673 RepID=UPI003CC70E32